ncbi:proline-rich transmembrane protein 1-like [Apostichopus japonicus]|uniref:proline-rich transmembrane protein 1-like n=1 Tax=Stichopus japonicus TaxID=307972 RepID=UPI003AB1E008
MYDPNPQHGKSGVTPTTVTIPRDSQVEPNNYMALAIFVTICCFLPTGIAAIVFSSRVKDLFNRGDVDGAQDAAAKAKKLSLISLVIGLILITISVILNITMGT